MPGLRRAVKNQTPGSRKAVKNQTPNWKGPARNSSRCTASCASRSPNCPTARNSSASPPTPTWPNYAPRAAPGQEDDHGLPGPERAAAGAKRPALPGMGRQSGRLRAQIGLACTDRSMAPASAPQAPAPVTPFCNIHVRPSLLRCPLAPGARIAPAPTPWPITHCARAAPARAGEAYRPPGNGGEYPAANGAAPRPSPSAAASSLVQGLPSGDKMDWVIEKPWSWARSASSRWRPNAACVTDRPRLEKRGWPTGNASPNRPVSNAAAIAS